MADRPMVERPDAPHPGHDPMLVVAFAAGDLEAADLARAGALVAACDECATLAADLHTIARATAELPGPRRPRDFFVRPADAERLRPRGLRRLAAAIRGPRIQRARPLAGGLMMLGFAGLLVAALPGMSQPGASSSADERLGFLASPAPAAPGAPGLPYATDTTLVDVHGDGGQAASLPPGAGAQVSAPPAEPETPRTGRDTAATGPSVLALGSVALVTIGAALFLLTLLRTGPRRT